jgi:hypothetical protein
MVGTNYHAKGLSEKIEVSKLREVLGLRRTRDKITQPGKFGVRFR